MTIITGIMTVLSLYPFTWEQTLILVGVIKALYDAVISKQWKKVEEIIKEEAWELILSTLDNEDKRDLVVKAVWNKMPRALRVVATADQVEKFVDQIYVTYVKPKAKREGLIDNKTEISDPLFGE